MPLTCKQARILLGAVCNETNPDPKEFTATGVRMTFLAGEWLWLLLAVPAIVTAYVLLLARNRRAVRYSNLALVREAMGAPQHLRRHLPPLILLVALIALLFAVARPALDVTAPVNQRTIILAMDASMSMNAADVAPTRMAAAKAGAVEFIKSLPRDVRVGVVSFSANADMVQVPTRNRAYLIEAVERLHVDYGTAIGTGMVAALVALFPDQGIDRDYDIFRTAGWHDGRNIVSPAVPALSDTSRFRPIPAGSYRSAAIILMTDGRSMAGLDPRVAARLAAQRGIRVYTVGFGTTGASTVNDDGEEVDASFDEDSLKAVAQITRAQYFHADTAAGLRDILRAADPTGRARTERGSGILGAVCCCGRTPIGVCGHAFAAMVGASHLRRSRHDACN